MASAILWTDELVQKVTKLWKNRTAGEITEIIRREDEVRLTRGMIVGKMNRLGVVKLNGPKPPPPRTRKAAAAPKATIPPKPQRASVSPETFTPCVVEIGPRHITLLELTDTTCRYECSGQDDPALYTFCGRPVAHGAYCGAHARLCYMAPPSRKLKAAA